MADVSRGPVSSMPGSSHALPAGATCDTHENVPAVRRVQGETDSFGCEYVDMCQACVDAHAAFLEQERSAEKYCDWHKGLGLDVRPHRDIDEGMAGRLYDVCAACRRKESDLLAKELKEYERDRGDDWWDEE